MKVLLAGPNIYEKGKLGGIITVMEVILELFPDMEYFSRSSEKTGNLLVSLLDFFKILFQWKAAVRENYDIIHLNTALMDSAIVRDYILCRMAYRQKCNILLHIHGGKYFSQEPNRFIGYLLHGMLRRSKGVVVLGENEKDYFKKHYQSDHVYVIPNAVNFNELPEPAPKFQHQTLRLIYFGRIVEAKGIYEILRALEKIKKEGSLSFHYQVNGNGKLLDSYIEECQEKLGANFTYGGVLSPAERWDVLNSMDVMLLPSYFEGLPMSLLEAMSVQCLCLTTPVGSIGDVILDKENGMLIPPRQSDPLREALLWIDAHREQAQTMGERGKQTVFELFRGSIYRERLLNVYGAL